MVDPYEPVEHRRSVMIVATSTSLGAILVVLILIAAAVYGVAYIAGKGAKRGSRD